MRVGVHATTLEQAFLDFLTETGSFLLTGHERPDGDCLGAQVALYHLLRALDKEVNIVNPDPLTPVHAFLSRHTPFSAYDSSLDLPDFEAAVLLDCSELSRLNALGQRLETSDATIAVVDHHVGSLDGDGSVYLVDSSAASTGTLIYRLFLELNVPIPKAAAEGVFLSLVSDTGWFKYSNTDSEVLATAARLVEFGVEPAALFDRLFRRNHVESVGLMESILSTHRFALGGKYGYICIDKAMMAQANRIDFDTDAALDPVRSVDGVEVVALFKERFDGSVKLSLRSSHDVDVREIAKSFGGGGHVKAAGATLDHSLIESLELVEGKVRQALAVAGHTDTDQ